MLHFDDDKLPHAKNDEHDWRESYYCNFFDQNSNLCGVFWPAFGRTPAMARRCSCCATARPT